VGGGISLINIAIHAFVMTIVVRVSQAAGAVNRSHSSLLLIAVMIPAVSFALTLVSSAQALPLAPLQRHDMTITVREACGAGMHMVNGVCVRTHARRATSRCARGVTC
jgi:hypothetical protein